MNKGNPDPSQGNPNQFTGGVTYTGTDGFLRNSATVVLNSQVTNCSALQNTIAHEIGHTMGLEHDCGAPESKCYAEEGALVMNNLLCAVPDSSGTGCVAYDLNNTTYGRDNPSYCENDVIKCRVYKLCPTPTPTPTPTPDECLYPANIFQYPQTNGCPYGRVNNGFGCCIVLPGTCNGTPDYGTYPSTGCASGFVVSGGVCTRSNSFINNCNNRFGGYDFDACGCLGACESGGSCSPIVIDVLGNGFDLTDAFNGVDFDLDGSGNAEQWSWTNAGSDDAWLVLDRNNNGLIDGGREMFGSVMAQPVPPEGEAMNGFRALAQFDEAGFGGNDDNKIDNEDAVFSHLRLWQDANHNGISEESELHALDALDVGEINLRYKESKRADEFGNEFRFRAKVSDSNGANVGRWAWDVFLKTNP